MRQIFACPYFSMASVLASLHGGDTTIIEDVFRVITLFQKGVPHSPPTPTILAEIWCINEKILHHWNQSDSCAGFESSGSSFVTVASDSNSSTNIVLERKTADIYSVAQFIILAPHPMLWAC